jgi:hypothetical protein
MEVLLEERSRTVGDLLRIYGAAKELPRVKTDGAHYYPVKKIIEDCVRVLHSARTSHVDCSKTEDKVPKPRVTALALEDKRSIRSTGSGLFKQAAENVEGGIDFPFVSGLRHAFGLTWSADRHVSS